MSKYFTSNCIFKSKILFKCFLVMVNYCIQNKYYICLGSVEWIMGHTELPVRLTLTYFKTYTNQDILIMFLPSSKLLYWWDNFIILNKNINFICESQKQQVVPSNRFEQGILVSEMRFLHAVVVLCSQFNFVINCDD